MSYIDEVKKETIGKYTFVLTDDDDFCWIDVYEGEKKIATHPIVESTLEKTELVYEGWKSKYLKL
jgi:hypothetical protein